MESGVGQWRGRFVEQLPNLAFGCTIVDDQFDALVSREIADDLGVDPWNRRELAGPIAVIVGPRQPGGGVGLPFGGHAIAECCRGST